jgi:hypothetical protein
MKEREIVKLHQFISTNLRDSNLSNGRMKNLLANYVLAVYLLKNVFNEMKLSSDGFAEEKSKDAEACINLSHKDTPVYARPGSDLIADILETLNRMAAEGKLINDVDYDSTRKADDEPCLRLNYTAFYDRFKKYCRDNNIDHEIIRLKDFKKELMRRDYCLYHSKPVTFRTGEAQNSFKTFRAAVLSLEKLKEMKLKIDCLVG